MKRIVIVLLMMMFVFQGAFSLDIGDDAPSFANPGLDKRFVFSKNYYNNGKWLLIDFFATWCENCKEELPYIVEFSEQMGTENLDVILMDVDKEGITIVKPYFEANPIPFKIIIDRYMVVAEKFGIVGSETESNGIPAVFLINPEGKIEYKLFGKSETVGEELAATISAYGE